MKLCSKCGEKEAFALRLAGYPGAVCASCFAKGNEPRAKAQVRPLKARVNRALPGCEP
jgi:hypothetical protein